MDPFRYPGARSNSDQQTLACAFKLWTSENMIADGVEIQDHPREAAAEHGVLPCVRFGHRVLEAELSSASGLWTVRCRHDGAQIELTARWLFGATGYYDREQGLRPPFPREQEFGRSVHPQEWPEARIVRLTARWRTSRSVTWR